MVTRRSRLHRKQKKEDIEDYDVHITHILKTTSVYNDLRGEYIHQWLQETNKKTLLSCVDSNDNINAFILFHLTDSDPLREHTKPYVIDYIYTYPEYRRRGLAKSLIDKITKERKYECTAFCDNDNSIKLFEKCGFMNFGGIMRYTIRNRI